MGTINYKRSDYITIGQNISRFDFYDYEKDFGELTDEEIEEIRNSDMTIEHEIIQEILDKYNFYYLHVTIQNGYYEGFYIDIENNFRLYFNDAEEKKESQKEVTKLKNFLFEVVENGLVQVSPGWCTSYASKEETKKAIKEAIKELRQEIKDTPTASKYFREGA